MSAQTENNDYNIEVQSEKNEENERRLFWWKIGSGFNFLYRIMWALIFGFAIYQNNGQCDDTNLVEFSEVTFGLMTLLAPFVCVIFVTSIMEKPYKALLWKRYFYWTIIIATFIDIVLLICAEIYYNEPETSF